MHLSFLSFVLFTADSLLILTCLYSLWYVDSRRLYRRKLSFNYLFLFLWWLSIRKGRIGIWLQLKKWHEAFLQFGIVLQHGAEHEAKSKKKWRSLAVDLLYMRETFKSFSIWPRIRPLRSSELISSYISSGSGSVSWVAIDY